MRYALVFIAFVHGVCHLAGYASVQRAGNGRFLGLAWGVLALAFVTLAAGVLMRTTWWLKLVPVLVAVSILCCVMACPEAKFGVVANLLVLVLAGVAVRYPGDVPAVRHAGLEALWASTYGAGQRVRLRMHGEIKIGAWHPFVAEQVIDAERGMVWAGTVSMSGLPVVGADQVLDGKGEMGWKVFDLFTVARGEGADISRSAKGRLLGEAVAWLPAVMGAGAPGSIQVRALEAEAGMRRLEVSGFGETVELSIRRNGVHAITFQRWGNPDGGAHRYVDFGVVVEQERAFVGHTIPARIRAGWYYGTERFDREGEFFRATIDAAEYRP